MALESTLERRLRDYCNRLGIYTRKFVSPGNRGVPDRVMHYQKKTLYIELKAPGKKPTPLQLREISLLNAQGIPAFWTDDLDACKALIQIHLLT